MYRTIAQVYKQVFEENPPIGLFEDFNNYKQAENNFSDDTLLIVEYHKIAKKQNKSPDSLAVWKNVNFSLLLLPISSIVTSNPMWYSI